MNFESRYWYLEHFRLIKRLTRTEMKYLCSNMKMVHFKKNIEIELGRKKVSDDVYFLKKGTVKIVNLSDDGEESIKNIIKRGDIYGIFALMGTENENDYAVAMEDSIVCVIDSIYMKKMMEENQGLNNFIFKLAGLRIKKLERNLATLIYKDARTRVESFIKDYIEELGEEKDGLIVAKNFLSNKEIGKLTSTSRQTVNKILNNLKRNGVIDFDKDMISTNKKVLQNS